MKISLDWAAASATTPSVPAAANATAATWLRIDAFIFLLLVSLCVVLRSMRERPEAKLLLADGPQAREPVGFDDQEEYDQRAEHHRFDMGDRRRRQGNS